MAPVVCYSSGLALLDSVVCSHGESDLVPELKVSCVSHQADWTLVIGEQALDICIPSLSPSASIFILGERNLYCLKDNGQIRFMKKLEYNPSCFLPYASGKAEPLATSCCLA